MVIKTAKSLLLFLTVSAICFIIGHWFKIPLLMYRHEYIDEAGLYTTTGSCAPVIIGFIASIGYQK
ncbi:hypothetical protein FZC66_14650 [Priestia megaterium]|nr:hypothetical protein FZC66_14650 [Priestia megaterium]